MFLNNFGVIRRLCLNINGLETIRSQRLVNHISKRCAGHSQWANRKEVRESSQKKKSSLIVKFLSEIRNEIGRSKNPNIETNIKLQSILGEARKASIPQSSLENAIKSAAASLENDVVHTFCFTHDMGIKAVIEVNSNNVKTLKLNAIGVLKKFGFQIENNAENIYERVGIVMCKPLKSEATFDKAFEDAVACNFTEVNEIEDGEYEFQCEPQQLKECTKKLTDLGYSVELSEVQYKFFESITIDDKQILNKLERINDRLNFLKGFIRIQYNIKGM